MGSLVSNSQGGFTKGRQIIDGILVVNELVDGKKRSQEQGLVCNVDLEKAYDRVDWDFLQWTMEKKGFKRKWIMGCLDHLHFSIIFNGVSKGFFHSSRGLRQGDPLLPFSYTFVANAFSALMSKAVDSGLLKGFEVSPQGPSVSHLQFVDDTICFVKASMEQVSNLKIVSKIFECISDLKVNVAKSSMVGIGVEESVLSSFTNNFGCKVEK